MPSLLSHRQTENPPDIDRRVPFITAYVVQCGICLIIVVLRFWSRMLLGGVRAIGWDDAIMAFTWVCIKFSRLASSRTKTGNKSSKSLLSELTIKLGLQVLYAALTIVVGFIGGNGGTRHLIYLTDPSHLTYVLKLEYIAQPFGIVAVGTGKISVAFLILRILGQTGKWRQRFLWCLIVITLIFTSTNAIFNFTQCSPAAALWDLSLRPTASCWDPTVEDNYGIFVSSWSAAVDLLLALTPVTIFWRLKMSTRKRLGLCLLMGCGIFGAVATIIKTTELTAMTARSDLTWQTYSLYLWVSAEIDVVIVCGSVATFVPLWDRFVRGKRRGDGTTGGYGTGASSGKHYERFSPSGKSGRSRGTATELWAVSQAGAGTYGAGTKTAASTESDTPRYPPSESSIAPLYATRGGNEQINVTHTVSLEWAQTDAFGSRV